MADNETSVTRVTTGVVTLSYPHVTPGKPYRGPGGDQRPKYSACLIYAPGADYTAEKKAVEAVLNAKFGSPDKWQAKLRTNPPGFRLPFRNDAESKGYPAGSMFFNARSDNPPGLVGRTKGPDGRPEALPPERFYPGCKVRALISAYWYDNVGKGVTFGLDGLQFWEDGERLDNRVNAQDAFDADLDEEPVSLADMQQAAPAAGGTSDPFNFI